MPLCFAIMPISTPADMLDKYGDPNHFVRVAKHIFKPAAEAAGFEFKAPASTSAVVIQAEIIEYLEKADLVLCDISTWNANVFFELGIRVALDRPVAMVRDHLTTSIPFDNSIVNTHIYDGRMDVWRVEDTVPILATFLKSAENQQQNALWKYFGITQRAARVDAGSPQDAKLELLLAEVEAIRRSGILAIEAAVASQANDLISIRLPREIGRFVRKIAISPVHDDINTVQDLLDSVYFEISDFVSAYTYGKSWVLRDERTGKVFKSTAGSQSGSNGRHRFDLRSLQNAGIELGRQYSVDILR